MTLSAIIAYIFENATINLIGFSYGIPILLGGLAFKITELKPIKPTQQPSPEVVELRKVQATQTQTQIVKDVTRYWYGQDAHLDTALKKVGLGPSKEAQPVLTGFHETEIKGAYALVLEFSSPGRTFDQWMVKQAKIERFFGPGVRAYISQPQEGAIELALIAEPVTAEAPISA
ncbi:DUF2854 domain-containing protein [Altericista sp. CCNU0014]|uniref:DUF2854 domain-containing protein n=1 Tax=Altericista sp. CCNU0014 TaxID=3082949 RepID=UPI00384CC8B3